MKRFTVWVTQTWVYDCIEAPDEETAIDQCCAMADDPSTADRIEWDAEAEELEE